MKITNIHQLLPFIQDKPEFKVIDKGDYQVIDYVYQDSNTFDKPELMECRGIKFDKDGLIIARPFRKFFNYGENGADLPFHRPHTITEKLDGSMIHPVMIGDKLYLMTRKGHTDVAKKAERFMVSSDIPYVSFMKYWLKNGWTPIFEYTGPDNRIVLRYNKAALTLLALRNTIDGRIKPYRDLCLSIAGSIIPCINTPKLYKSHLTNVKSFIEHTRKLQDAEGYVIYFDDGYMVKIKAEDYVLKHRALDDMGSKKKVVALCCQGFMDDVLPILSLEDQTELLQFNSSMQKEISHMERKVNIAHTYYFDYEEKNPDTARKQFALNINSILPKHLHAAAFVMIDGKNIRPVLLKMVEQNNDLLVTKWRGV